MIFWGNSVLFISNQGNQNTHEHISTPYLLNKKRNFTLIDWLINCFGFLRPMGNIPAILQWNFTLKDEMGKITTIIFQTAWHFASASGLKFSHYDHNKDNDWIFDINEICISNTNQTIQWPIAFSVCQARFSSKQNTHFN